MSQVEPVRLLKVLQITRVLRAIERTLALTLSEGENRGEILSKDKMRLTLF